MRAAQSFEEKRKTTPAENVSFPEAKADVSDFPESTNNRENEVVVIRQLRNSDAQDPENQVDSESNSNIQNSSFPIDAQPEMNPTSIVNAVVSINVVEAFVPERTNDEIITAERHDVSTIMERKRSIKWFFFSSISILVATVILVTVAIFPKSNGSESRNLRVLAIEISGSDALEIPNSPQSKALEWMENEDKIHIPVNEKYRFVQRYVSAIIYFATSDPTSGLSNGVIYLNGTVHECEWDEWTLVETRFSARKYCRGQHCEDNNTLSRLNLYHSNMTGTIPSEIQFLTNLRTLNFGGNKRMTGTIPTEIGKLSKLEELFLFNMNLTGTLPLELQNLKSLLRVSTYGNHYISHDYESNVCSIPNLLFFQADCGNGTLIPQCSCCHHCCNPDIQRCCDTDGNCYNTNPDIEGHWAS